MIALIFDWVLRLLPLTLINAQPSRRFSSSIIYPAHLCQLRRKRRQLLFRSSPYVAEVNFPIMPIENRPKTKVLMIGPLPPPIGGVANFVKNIAQAFSLSPKYRIEIVRIGKAANSESPLSILLRELVQNARFLKNFKKNGAKIVHVHTSSYYSFLISFPYMFWTKFLLKARLVVHVHGGRFKEFYQGSSIPIKYFVKTILSSADAVIVTSPSWVKILGEISGREEGIYPLANGFDPAIFHPRDKLAARTELGLPLDKRILLTVGYLEEVKGHRFLLEAMPEIIKHSPDVQLFIIGTGPLKEELLASIKKMRIEDRVSFFDGGQTSERIALWMNSADLFVLPSLSEGNPTVLFECLGCGRPFLGTRVGGIADIITSKELGALCDPSDPTGLAVAIAAMLDKRWDADYISTYAQQYSWNSISTNLEEIYDRIFGEDIKKPK